MDVPEGYPLSAYPTDVFEGVHPKIQQKLVDEILTLNGVKFQLALRIQLDKTNPDGSEEFTSPLLRHRQEVLLQADEIKDALDRAFRSILESLEKWTQKGSGWVVDRLQTLWLDITRYQPLRGESYIPLPAAVQNKKAVVYVKNQDDYCLRWSLRAALAHPSPPHHPERPRWYPAEDGLNFERIDALMPVDQVTKVERQNSLAINVFGWDKGVIVHRLSKQSAASLPDMRFINLLLLETDGRFLRPQSPPLRPDKARRPETLLCPLSPRLFQGGSPGGPQA